MADLKKTFGQDWIANTATGKALDTVTGGALGRHAKKQRVNREGKGDREGVRMADDPQIRYAKKKGKGK